MTDSEALRGFPVVIEIPVAWGEMDSFGHVNNIVYFRYFESARIAYFDAIRFRADDGVGPILASTQCRFRLPLTYPDTVRVGARAHSLGDDRFSMDYVILSTRLNAVAAEGGGLVVAYDYKGLRKTALPTAVRERMDSLEAGNQK